MNLLGCKYCECKKSYYRDSHKKPKTVAYRYSYMNKYLIREFRCYRQIQLSEETYKEMLENGDILSGTPVFQFHIDDCSKFCTLTSWLDIDSAKFGGFLSARKLE